MGVSLLSVVAEVVNTAVYCSVFNKHTLHCYQLVCRDAHLSPEMRNGEGRKIVFVYSTGSIKILGPLPLMLHLIPSSFFFIFSPSASSD